MRGRESKGGKAGEARRRQSFGRVGGINSEGRAVAHDLNVSTVPVQVGEVKGGEWLSADGKLPRGLSTVAPIE